jgi:hypothetical protein
MLYRNEATPVKTKKPAAVKTDVDDDFPTMLMDDAFAGKQSVGAV